MSTENAASRQVKNTRPILRHLLTVYIAGELVGSIEEGRGCVARDADGVILGVYGNRRVALAAIQRVAAP